MSLEDSLRWSARWPGIHRVCPDRYSTREPDIDANWRWLHLWQQENPNPGTGKNFDDWYDEYAKMHARVWVAACLPQARVFDWSDEHVALARTLVSSHVCGVCGRVDDSGCWLGC